MRYEISPRGVLSCDGDCDCDGDGFDDVDAADCGDVDGRGGAVEAVMG